MTDRVDLGLKVNAFSASTYDYQDLLERAICPFCLQSLEWMLGFKKENDDKFCRAVCCGKIYHMFPQRVTVITTDLN